MSIRVFCDCGNEISGTPRHLEHVYCTKCNQIYVFIKFHPDREPNKTYNWCEHCDKWVLPDNRHYEQHPAERGILTLGLDLDRIKGYALQVKDGFHLHQKGG